MFYTHTTISSKSWNNFLRSKNSRKGSYWPKTSFSTFVDGGFFEKYFKYFFIFFCHFSGKLFCDTVFENPFHFFVCLRKVWFISLLFCHFSRKLFFWMPWKSGIMLHPGQKSISQPFKELLGWSSELKLITPKSYTGISLILNWVGFFW